MRKDRKQYQVEELWTPGETQLTKQEEVTDDKLRKWAPSPALHPVLYPARRWR